MFKMIYPMPDMDLRDLLTKNKELTELTLLLLGDGTVQVTHCTS
jgi:hypothetical protein